jgi:methionyl-tRNA formyltransferase
VEAAPAEDGPALAPGALEALPDRLLAGAGRGTLEVVRAQLAGKRALPGADFARGLRLERGAAFE